ncbi:protein daughter of sevenless [Onthophagus taurus]|uniref:protein daughter of sevenless n=1 Tax=Onthophagus taurus TaxID=166361 RepID=UPI000C2030E5|nr:GRB2-associated-binding protein 1 [Onthophagus taurus]
MRSSRNMSRDIICEGWLVKSPPSKRIWRARWRKRWFTLSPGEFPQQYILTYYSDKNYRKLKGFIDLSHCEQVDVGFKLDDRRICDMQHIFAIKTEKRIYYLAAETETELQNWTRYVCDVCGLKPTNGDDGVEAHSVIDEPLTNATDHHDHQNMVQLELRNTLETPPISPVSTSPYIPISECITGKSPVFCTKDLSNLTKEMLRTTCDPIHVNSLSNQIYEGHEYHNFVAPPINYEIPRSLLPKLSKPPDDGAKGSDFDSDSVFTDDTWSESTVIGDKGPRTPKYSDSSADMDAFLAQRVGRLSMDSSKIEVVPPRPPKPAHINQGSSYLNISGQSKISNVNEEVKHYPINDETYDFPRSHRFGGEEASSLNRRHCYNNAAPGICGDGKIFRFDVITKPNPNTISQDFHSDTDAASDIPPSPSSQCSSAMYSNLPSPNLTEQVLSPPPVVNRGLKPKRKLSDTRSITSNPEPSSPRLAPNVDRHLKPLLSIPSPDPGLYTNLIPNKGTNRKIRAAPSPTPPTERRSFSDVSCDNEEVFRIFPNKAKMKDYFKLEYLDLDLDALGGPAPTVPGGSICSATSDDTIYKKVDFFRTEAFKMTKTNLEKERNKFS